jgi:hypothetical protein
MPSATEGGNANAVALSSRSQHLSAITDQAITRCNRFAALVPRYRLHWTGSARTFLHSSLSSSSSEFVRSPILRISPWKTTW